MSRRITRLYGKKTDRHVSNDGKNRPLKNYLRILGFDKVWVLTGELCDTILPSHKRFVAIFFRCRNNSYNNLAYFLESAKNFLIFAMSKPRLSE